MRLQSEFRIILCLAAILLIAGPGLAMGVTTVFVVDPTVDYDWVAAALADFGSLFGSDDSMGLMIADTDTMSWTAHDFGAGAGQYLTTWGAMSATLAGLTPTGAGDVDGLNGIWMALEDTIRYPSGPLGTNIILITDGGMPTTPWGNTDIDAAVNGRQASASPGGGSPVPAKVNVIIDHGFTDGSQPAMGVDRDTAYVADGPGWSGVPGPDIDPGRTTGGPYLDAVRNFGGPDEFGTSWDLLAAQGPDQGSFAKGFKDVKLAEFGGGGGIFFPPGPGGGGGGGGGGTTPPDPVPEPGTWLLLLAGAGLLARARRR